MPVVYAYICRHGRKYPVFLIGQSTHTSFVGRRIIEYKAVSE